MYNNMEITIFGIKLEIWIIILILLFIILSHIGCSCTHIGLLDGLNHIQNMMYTSSTSEGQNGRAFNYMTSFPTLNEGFTSTINDGESASYNLRNSKPLNTSKWFTPNLTYTKGKKVGKGVQNILNRPQQQVPPSNSELLLFANNKFSPSCCPSSLSNSSGCACITVPQYNYLINRGGNNVPYSEY